MHRIQLQRTAGRNQACSIPNEETNDELVKPTMPIDTGLKTQLHLDATVV